MSLSGVYEFRLNSFPFFKMYIYFEVQFKHIGANKQHAVLLSE